MFSFATRPMTVATADCQSPKPRGLNTNATPPPMVAAKLVPRSPALCILPSTMPKAEMNQTKMDDKRMMEPAFLTKLHPRSHVALATLLKAGRR